MSSLKKIVEFLRKLEETRAELLNDFNAQLSELIDKKNININKLAAILGCHRDTFYLKLANGDADFLENIIIALKFGDLLKTGHTGRKPSKLKMSIIEPCETKRE